jgi:hypothetical protein
MFFHQSDQFVTDFALLLQIFALLLQIFALLFGIKSTEINQSQSSNIFMYIIKDNTVPVFL